MVNQRFVHMALGIILCFVSLPVFGQQFPQPTGFVNDFAKVLSAEEAGALEAKLQAYQQATGIELAVAIVPSLDDMSVEEYANKLFAQWGVGQKGKDNGVLFLLAPKERRVRIEVGYGLEPDLTDGASGEILDTYAVPQLKDNNWAAGTSQSVEGIIGHLGQMPYQARLEERQRQKEERARADEASFQVFLNFMLGALVLTIAVTPPAILVYRKKRRKELRKMISQTIDECKAHIERVLKEYVSAKQALPSFVEKIPKTEFDDAIVRLETIPEKMQKLENNLQDFPLSSAKKLGTLEQQYGGLRDLNEELRLISPAGLIVGIQSRVAERKKAEKDSKELFNSIPSKLAGAKENKTVDGGHVAQAEKKFQEARAQSQSSSFDWLTVYALLYAANKLLDSPSPSRSRSSYSSSSSYRSSSSSHRSGGGFGGFGGGRSGGGGASRGF